MFIQIGARDITRKRSFKRVADWILRSSLKIEVGMPMGHVRTR